MTVDDLRREVLAQREAQGLPPEPSAEQLAFVGAVIASDRRRREDASVKNQNK